MGPGRAQDRTQARVWMAPLRDSNRLLGLSETRHLMVSGDRDKGGSNLRKLEGGGEDFEFSAALNLTLFYRASIENPQFGGHKSKLSKDNLRGEFLPSSVRYVLTPPHPRFQVFGDFGWVLGPLLLAGREVFLPKLAIKYCRLQRKCHRETSLWASEARQPQCQRKTKGGGKLRGGENIPYKPHPKNGFGLPSDL